MPATTARLGGDSSDCIEKKEEAAVVFDASCFVPSFWKSQILTVTNICELV